MAHVTWVRFEPSTFCVVDTIRIAEFFAIKFFLWLIQYVILTSPFNSFQL